MFLVDLPNGTSEPNTLLTTGAVARLGLQQVPAAWLLRTGTTLTAAQTLPALTTPASTPHVAMTMSAPVSASARRRRTMPSPCLLPGISSAKNTGRRRKRTDREVAVAQTRLAYHYQHA